MRFSFSKNHSHNTHGFLFVVSMAIVTLSLQASAQEHRVLAMCRGVDKSSEESAIAIENALQKTIESSERFARTSLDVLSGEREVSRAGEIETLVKGAEESLAGLEAEDAQSKIAIARNLAAKHSDTLDKNLMANVFVIEGLIARAVGEGKAARSAFRSALSISPEIAEKTGIELSKADRDLFDAVKKTMGFTRKKSLRVTTASIPKRVYVDGVFRGFSPVTLRDLTPGAHVVLALREGFAREAAIVDVSAQSERDFDRGLARALTKRIREEALTDTSLTSVYGLINSEGIDALFCEVRDASVQFAWRTTTGQSFVGETPLAPPGEVAAIVIAARPEQFARVSAAPLWISGAVITGAVGAALVGGLWLYNENESTRNAAAARRRLLLQ